jgi:hypothetical protein
MEEIINKFADLKPTHKYYCDSCQDTGKIETIVYTGKDIGYLTHGQEIISYDRFARICWNYHKALYPSLPDYNKFLMSNKEAIETYCKSAERYNPSAYYDVKSTNPCTCRRGNWTKEKKQYD